MNLPWKTTKGTERTAGAERASSSTNRKKVAVGSGKEAIILPPCRQKNTQRWSGFTLFNGRNRNILERICSFCGYFSTDRTVENRMAGREFRMQSDEENM